MAARDEFKSNQLSGTGTFYKNGFFYDSPENRRKPKATKPSSKAQSYIKKLEYKVTQEQLRRKFAEDKVAKKFYN